MRKAGVTFQRDIRTWFNVFDPAHVAAYTTWRTTGEWPAGFISDEIWLGPGREEILVEAVAGVAVATPKEESGEQ